MSDTADPADPVQEFAERVADAWFFDKSDWRTQYDELVSHIADELRAGGWVKRRAGPDVVASEDFTIR